MPELERTLTVDATVQEAYDACKGFYIDLGYDIIQTGEPAYISFEREGSIWAFHDIKATHQVRVAINRKDDLTLINLNYDAPEGIGKFSKKSEKRIDHALTALESKIEDIVKRRKLIEKEKRFRLIFEQSPLPIIILDPQTGEVRDFNDRAHKFLGYEPEDLRKTTMTDWIADRNPDEVMQELQRVLQIGRESYEDVIITKNGEKRDVINHLQIFTINRKVAIYLIMVDITDRKQNERRTKDLNSLLMTIRNISQLIHRGTDFETVIQSSCTMLADTRDYSDVTIATYDGNKNMIVPSSHSGKYLWANWGISLDGRGNAPECVKDVLKTKSTKIINSTHEECGDCNYCLHEEDHKSIIVPLLEDKNVIGMIIICMDIADLSYKRDIDRVEVYLLGGVASTLVYSKEKLTLDEELDNTEKNFNWLIENIPDPVLVVNKSGVIEYANPAFCRKTGYTKDEIEDKSVSNSEVMSQREYNLIMDDLVLKMTGDNVGNFEIDIKPKDGDIITTEVTTKILKEKGNVIGEILLLKDL